MSNAIELAQVWVPLMPEASRLAGGVDKIAKNAEVRFVRAGKVMGAGLANGVDGGARKAADGMKAVERATDSLAKARARDADAAGRLRVAQAGLEDLSSKAKVTAKQRAAAEEAVERALRQQTVAADAVTRAQKDLDGARSSMSRASFAPMGAEVARQGADTGEDFVGGFSGVAARLGMRAGPIGAALAGAATLGFAAGKEIVGQVEAGMRTLSTRDLFAAKLGVDDATMEKLAAAAADAYTAQWGATVEDNMAAGQFAIQAHLIDAGAAKKDIQGVIQQLQTLAAVMGIDVQEAARGAGKLLTTGVAKSADEAFDLLIVGSQKGLDLTGDLVDTLEEYATKWRDVGLTGQESLGLINQMLKGGARNTDQAADALKEFSIRVVDNSKTTREAFQTLGLNADDMANRFAAGGQSAHDAFDQVLDKLRDVHDPLTQEVAGVALFGTKWEDVGDALKQVDLSTAADDLGKVDGASQRAADKVSEHASQWDALGRNISTAFGNFQTGLAESGFGKWLGTTLPGYLNDAMFPEDIPTFPSAPGESLGTSGVYGPVSPPTEPVQGPGIPQPPIAPSAPMPPSVTGVLQIPVTGPLIVDPRIKAPAPRAAGGIDGWGPPLGKLPGSALIQQPVGPQGLIQWAEPSTGGEAYIPLGTANRSRSLAIWKETGRRLGALRSFAGGGMLGDNGGLLPFTRQLRDLTLATWPQISDIGGYRSPDGYNEHSSGRALDVMIPSWQTPQGRALGDQIAQWALSIPGVDRVMWQSSIIRPGGRVEPVADRGSPTANHQDHVHIFTDQMPSGSVPSASMPMSNGFLGRSGGGSSVAVTQASNRLADAEGNVREREARLAEVQADIDAKESARIGAEEDLAKARRDRDQARLELDQARADATTAGSDQRGSKPSGPDAKSFGQQMFAGALEVLGIGDVFDDPTSWGIWKLGTGLANYLGGLAKNAFGGPTEGGMWGPRGLYQGDPNSSRHGRGGGSPGPGNFGVNDGGLSGLNFADPGSAIGDTLSSILPNVRDFLPNSQTQTTPGGGNTYTTNHDSNNTSNTGAVINGNVTVNQQPGQPVRGNTYTLTLPAVGR